MTQARSSDLKFQRHCSKEHEHEKERNIVVSLDEDCTMPYANKDWGLGKMPDASKQDWGLGES